MKWALKNKYHVLEKGSCDPEHRQSTIQLVNE